MTASPQNFERIQRHNMIDPTQIRVGDIVMVKMAWEDSLRCWELGIVGNPFHETYSPMYNTGLRTVNRPAVHDNAIFVTWLEERVTTELDHTLLGCRIELVPESPPLELVNAFDGRHVSEVETDTLLYHVPRSDVTYSQGAWGFMRPHDVVEINKIILDLDA